MPDRPTHPETPAAGELLARAVDIAADRDRWRALALDLQARLDGPGGDDHDPWLWRIWRDQASDEAARADELGTRAALAERAVRLLLADPRQRRADTRRAVAHYQRGAA